MAAPHIIRPREAEPADEFSPVGDDPPLRWERALHIAPVNGLGVARRAVVFAVVSWVPIAAWSLIRGRFFDAVVGEPLLQHYGVHVRCLLVIPLLILGEATLNSVARRCMPQFVVSGLVDAASRPRFEATLRTMRTWRDATLPWLFAIGLAVAWTLVDRRATSDEMSWAIDQNGGLGFGGIWFAYVVRPIFVGLLIGWLWRVALLTVLFARVGRLGLSIVPSHPDGAGGLGFLDRIPGAFAPITFAISATLASHWAHLVVYHGQTLNAFAGPAGLFVVAWMLMLLAPLATFVPSLHVAKEAALPGYAGLVAQQGRAVRRRWIEGAIRTDVPALEPDGVGPIADAAQMFGAVKAMRKIPISRASMAAIVVPIAVPMLFVIALQIPLWQLFAEVAKALM